MTKVMCFKENHSFAHLFLSLWRYLEVNVERFESLTVVLELVGFWTMANVAFNGKLRLI